MEKENIFVGEIRKIQRDIIDEKGTNLDKYYMIHEHDEPSKECAVLYKCYEDKYLEITPSTTLIDIKLAELDMSDKVISTIPTVGKKYVNEESLEPYCKNLEDKKVRFKKFKHEMLLDPRLPIGIKW